MTTFFEAIFDPLFDPFFQALHIWQPEMAYFGQKGVKKGGQKWAKRHHFWGIFGVRFGPPF